MRRFLLPLLLMPSMAWAACPVAGAHYVLQGYPDVTADFFKRPAVRDLQGDLILKITVKSLDWSFWYVPDGGNGYGRVTLTSVEDPTKPGWRPAARGGHEDEEYYGFQSDLTPGHNEGFDSSDVADEIVFLPNFGQHLWYGGPGRWDRLRYRLPRAVFRLKQCAKPRSLIPK